jgi:flavin reductase (DIM6/NTAB) family NADH-FMN oxidoreductase RutF
MTIVRTRSEGASAMAMADLPPVTGKAFRDCIARLPSGVHVVTTSGPAGPGGFTATAVASVSDDPPIVLVCLNRTSPQTAVFHDNGRFAVNLLPAGSSGLADAFAGRTGLAVPERFKLGSWTQLVTGSPVLETAVMALDCALVDAKEMGTHTVFFGKVVGTLAAPHAPEGEAEILIYHDRHYTEV